jgi:hypothetical protein
MVTKVLKTSLIIVVTVCLVGGLLFGKDLVSYIRSSVKSVQSAVKDSVPVEYELCRARDLLEEIIPEMHGNIRLIAQEEVEIANLKTDIARSQENLGQEKQRVSKLRQSLDMQNASYAFGDRKYTRDQVKEDLSRRFEQFKESELVLAGKKRLLATRENSLQAAMQLLDRTRSQKRLLEEKIETLASQYQLVKASAVGSPIQVDSSKLAQAEKLIGQIKKRLTISERVLAHESRFVQAIPVDTVMEADLLTQIDEYFTPTSENNPTVGAEKVPDLCKAGD